MQRILSPRRWRLGTVPSFGGKRSTGIWGGSACDSIDGSSSNKTTAAAVRFIRLLHSASSTNDDGDAAGRGSGESGNKAGELDQARASAAVCAASTAAVMVDVERASTTPRRARGLGGEAAGHRTSGSGASANTSVFTAAASAASVAGPNRAASAARRARALGGGGGGEHLMVPSRNPAKKADNGLNVIVSNSRVFSFYTDRRNEMQHEIHDTARNTFIKIQRTSAQNAWCGPSAACWSTPSKNLFLT